uniref:ATP synthase CF1 epsilon subunit n=1 Tax=Cuscuta bonafortunae TaxID=1197926 RepID=A0A4Y6GUF6_9ASTE|nr:ATP synthase CF1 epsilon subunit [Cuscuta bonafortunae]QDF46573.1 ATP synthase CF1 epsilon subunit [Cuscuta bonafortunae]
MTLLKLYVLTPNQIVWDSEVEQIILSTKSGQIGILPDHIPIATVLDIGILKIYYNGQWLSIALMGGVARIAKNAITIFVNYVERGSEISRQEAQETLEIAETNLRNETKNRSNFGSSSR